MGLCSSKRLAAFQLGYHMRITRIILAAGIVGFVRKIHPCVEFDEQSFRVLNRWDIHRFIKVVDRSFLVLAAGPAVAEYMNVKPTLQRAGELHDIACSFGPDETESDRRAWGALETEVLEEIEFLSGRLVRDDARLDAWRDVGEALAELKHRTLHIYAAVPIPASDWGPLNRAVDRLPSEDRKMASQLTRMEYYTLKGLAAQITDTYNDIHQYLMGPDRDHEGRTPIRASRPIKSAMEPRSSSAVLVGPTPSLFDEPPTGLLHTEDYSICLAKEIAYNLLPPAQALVRSLNEWLAEGVPRVGKKDIFKKCDMIYINDENMTEIVQSIYDRHVSKVFQDSGAWKSLVKPDPDRKGLYFLDL
jgi:hypothetical protein